MTVWSLSLAAYAAFLAVGCTLVVLAFLLRPAKEVQPAVGAGRRKSSGSHAFRRNLWSAALAGLGLGLVAYVAFLLASNHRSFILTLMRNGQDANIVVTVMLGLLGLVMTMVTIGVIGVSERAVHRLKELQDETIKLQNQHRTEIQGYKRKLREHSRELAKRRGWMRLLQKRLFLLYQNEKELELFDATDPRPAWAGFRESLAIIYAKGSDKDLLEYLDLHYQRARDGDLLSEEKEYLVMLEAYYAGIKDADAVMMDRFKRLHDKIGFPRPADNHRA